MYRMRVSATDGKRKVSINTANLTKTRVELERAGFSVDGMQLHKVRRSEQRIWARAEERATR